MSHLDKDFFVPAPFFLVRTPFFPMEEFYNLLKVENGAEYILSLFKERSELKEAIAVASPSLYETLVRMTSEKKLQLKENDQAISSLFKYILRMATRATPFGLFSFVSLGIWGNKGSQIDLSSVCKRARPDMEWLMEVIDESLKEPSIASAFFVKRNPLIYESMGRIVLPYSRKKDQQKKQVSIRSNPLILLILDITLAPVAVSDLLEQIISKLPELEKEKVLGVVVSLIHQEILCSSLLPTLLTASPFQDLIHHVNKTLFSLPQVADHERVCENSDSNFSGQEAAQNKAEKDEPENCKECCGQALAERLKSFSERIESYNAASIGKGEQALHALIEEAKGQNGSSSSIQVDMYSKQEINLPDPVRIELAKGVNALWSLSSVTKGVPGLRSYHHRFLDKYGTFRIVPLLELLDDTVGLGIPREPSEISLEPKKEELWGRWLSEQWIECIREKRTEIVLNDEVIERFRHEESANKALSSFDVFFELVPNKNKDFSISLHALSNQAGGCATFGRFLDILGKNTEEKVRTFFQEEEKINPKSILAEISYFPSSPRSANVAIHPNLRNYKIDVGYGQAQGHTLLLEDIFVGATPSYLFLTLRDGEQRIIAEAANVLNTAAAPPVVRFLRDVSKDCYSSFSFFSWGKLEGLNFLPSIRYGKTYLAPAQWHLTLSLVKGLEKDSIEEIVEKIKVWAKNWSLPRFVLMTWADHQILLDTTHSFHIKEIAQRLKSDPKLPVVLIEKMGEEEWVISNRGHHRCEFVVPFLKNEKYSFVHEISTGFTPISSVSRWKMPGGEWFYAKIYLPKENEVRFLAFYLDAFIKQIKGKIEKWFFIRYTEGNDSHIRLRCKVDKEETLAFLIQQFHLWAKELMEKGWIRDAHLASYEREIERYGGEQAIDLAETFFQSDSEAAIGLQQQLSLKRTQFPDYILAAFGLIDLLKEFGLSFQQQQAIFAGMDLKKELLEGFREWKSKMAWALGEILHENTDPAPEQGELSAIREILRARREKQKLYSEALHNRADLTSILQSVMHMHCNRLLGVDHSLEQKAYLYTMKILSTLQLKQSARELSHQSEGYNLLRQSTSGP